MNVRARRLSGPVRQGLSALAILFLAALPGPLPAQQISRSFAQGTHLFRRILYDLDLRPLRSLQQLAEDPEEKLLIVLGETEYGQSHRNLENFVKRGGALLLATDRDCKRLLSLFSIEVVGRHVEVAGDTRFAYKGSRECIFIEPGDRDSPLFENLSVKEDLSRVATNRPGYLLLGPDCHLQLWARFPPGCSAINERVQGRGPRFERRVEIPPDPSAFAVGGAWGEGRILILSDHSVFINAMMGQLDLENFDFAYNCVNWLTEGGKRRQVLFLEEGEIQESFKVPLKEPPLPPLPPLKTIVEFLDNGLGELERDNVFNRALHNAVSNITSPPEKWERVVILISTLALALFGLARLSQARHRHEKLPPLALSGLGRAPSSPSLFEQRSQSMVREGNFWEAARALARQGLESALGSQFRGDQKPSEGATTTLPSLPLQRSWWRGWRLRRRLKRLWQLAYGTEPVRISFRQLKRLGPEIEKMKAVLARHDAPHGRPPGRRG